MVVVLELEKEERNYMIYIFSHQLSSEGSSHANVKSKAPTGSSSKRQDRYWSHAQYYMDRFLYLITRLDSYICMSQYM